MGTFFYFAAGPVQPTTEKREREANMKLIYDIHDKPSFGKTLVFAFQQLLAILAATIAVPTIIGNGMSQSAALFGAGVGSIVYLLFTKLRSPVFLGSSFAFIGSMFAAFGGAASAEAGFAGIILGAVFAGLVYVVIAIVVKAAGVKWIDKLMPAVVIGPTVSIIGLSLAGNAIGDLTTGKVMKDVTVQIIENGQIVDQVNQVSAASPYVCLICGLVTLFTVMLCSVYGRKMAKLIPFILGILAGYIVAAIFTVIGRSTGNLELQVIDFTVFRKMQIFAVPQGRKGPVRDRRQVYRHRCRRLYPGRLRGLCRAYCRPQEPVLCHQPRPAGESRPAPHPAR